jgi:hypothetical protein
MSELTDTLVLAISEETGKMILARNGKFLENLKFSQAEQKINEYLHQQEPEHWEHTGSV